MSLRVSRNADRTRALGRCRNSSGSLAIFAGNCNLPATVQRFKRGNMKSVRFKFALSIIAFVIACPSFAFAQVTVDFKDHLQAICFARDCATAISGNLA